MSLLPGSGAACAVHPATIAGWDCPACGLRCVECVGSHRAGYASIAVCAGCGGSVTVLKRHRTSTRFVDALPAVLRFPFQGWGPVAMVTLGVGIGLFNLAGFFGSILAFSCQWALVFHLVRETAHGKDTIEPPDMGDFFGDIIAPALRAIAASSVPFLPVLLYARFVANQYFIDHRNPVELLLLAAGAAYLPLTLLIAATNSHLGRLFNPLAAVHDIKALGEDYAIAAVVTVVVGGIDLGLRSLLDFQGALSWLLLSATSLWAPITIGRLLGMLLYRRGDAVGYGRTQDFLVPIVSEAPRGVWLPPMPVEAVAKVVEPIALEEPAEAIARAMTESRFDDALAMLREGGLRPGEVAPDHLVALAQRASGQGDFGLALRVLDGVILANGAAPAAAKAMVIAGRIQLERVNNPAEAKRLFQRVVAQFPGTEAAAFAAKRLAEPGLADLDTPPTP